jgi:aryl-alcohol dehydrogenase-like predicted oxidoreductase
METRRLGASDLFLTPVVFGAWGIGGLMWGGSDEDEAVDAMRAALDAGINAIDTAASYGDGASEVLVGRALRGRRAGVVVATKCGLKWDQSEGASRLETLGLDGRTRRLSHDLRPASVREECEASLRRLGVETIDLYQIHRPDPVHGFEDALAEMLKLRDEGKVRWIGVSNFTVEQAERARRVAGIVSVQPGYSLLEREVEADLLPWSRRAGVGLIAYSPLARGLLAGRIRADTEFPATDHRSSLPLFAPESRRRVLRGLEEVRPVAEAHGVSLANLAVAWVIGEPGVTAAIVGARTPAQAADNARAAAVRLSDGERRAVARAFSFPEKEAR